MRGVEGIRAGYISQSGHSLNSCWMYEYINYHELPNQESLNSKSPCRFFCCFIAKSPWYRPFFCRGIFLNHFFPLPLLSILIILKPSDTAYLLTLNLILLAYDQEHRNSSGSMSSSCFLQIRKLAHIFLALYGYSIRESDMFIELITTGTLNYLNY